MLKKYALIGLLCVLSSPLFARNPVYLETGSLLFVQPVEPCDVYVDGVFRGQAPVLLTDIRAGNRLLQLKGEGRYNEVQLKYNSSKSDVCYYSPELAGYLGSLYISGENFPEETQLFLNGKEFPFKPNSSVKIEEGVYDLRLECSGYRSVERQQLILERDQTLSLNLPMERAIQVTFDTVFPQDTEISFFRTLKSEEVLTFRPQDDIILSPGEWIMHIESLFFAPVDDVVTLVAEPLVLSAELDMYHPIVNLVGLTEESVVFLNFKNVTDQLEGNQLKVPVGENNIIVSQKKYSPFEKDILIQGNETLDVVLDYNISPQTRKAQRLTAGVVFLSVGAALITGGLVMNMDRILMEISPDYDTYSALKYVTLGIAGLGAASVTTGSIFSFSALGIKE